MTRRAFPLRTWLTAEPATPGVGSASSQISTEPLLPVDTCRPTKRSGWSRLGLAGSGFQTTSVTLTVTEFLILQALAQRPGVVKSRDALMDAAYDDQVYVDDRTIDSHIKRLRKKFKAVDSSFDVIETLYGVGYRFKE